MAVVACPPVPVPPTRGIVVFDTAEFVIPYPAFAMLTNLQMQSGFDVATLFLLNTCCSVVQDAPTRQRLLYMVTAHVLALIFGENGLPPSGIVGRVDSAKEGTVAVTASYAAEMSMSEAYFSQTKYGAMFWQATLPYRTMMYFAPPADACVGRAPGFPGPGFPGGWPGGNCC